MPDFKADAAFPAIRKRLGQHFLHQKGIIERIIDAIQPQPGQHIVEIGPGRGALTGPLLETGVDLTAIELDTQLAQLLQQNFGHRDNLHLFNEDIMDFGWQQLDTAQPLRIVGNLPYSIASPLIFRLVSAELPPIFDLHVMVQKEVGFRLTSVTGDKDYSRASTMMDFCCELRQRLFIIAPGSFTPPPGVDSIMLRLKPLYPRPDQVLQQMLDKVLRTAFNHRRKTLYRSLRPLLTAEDWQQLNIDPLLRPGNLNTAEFTSIAQYLLASETAAGG